MRWLVTLALGLSVALSASNTRADAEVDALETGPAIGGVEGFFVLSFNRWGELSSPFEAGLIENVLRDHREIERIYLMSHGWANDAEVSYETYRGMVQDLLGTPGDDDVAQRDAGPASIVIGIGWDSSQTGFRKLFDNLIPFPVVASWLAYLPDAVMFPISFWSKAAMADRIGYGGLRTTLNEILGTAYDGRDDHPEIVLIGHSFGARILSGLMKQELALASVQAEPFESAEYVSGAVLFQPALALPNLDRTADYPILVTQSRHDHANGFLFPIANTVVNAYSFTSFEGLMRDRVFGVVSETVERGTEVLPELPDPLPEFELPMPPLANRPSDLFERGMAEIVSTPLALTYSAVALPVNYAAAQLHGFALHPVDHTLDTLAQLPVVEALVDGLGAAVGREVPWGAHGKGFLSLGLLNESPGRLVVTPYRAPRDFPLLPLRSDPSGTLDLGPCGEQRCEGLVFLDASSRISTGAFGLSLENRWVDYTFGWIDPIGAHADYRNPDIVEMMLRMAEIPAPAKP